MRGKDDQALAIWGSLNLLNHAKLKIISQSN